MQMKALNGGMIARAENMSAFKENIEVQEKQVDEYMYIYKYI